jgi:hypothetical protein
MANRISSEAAYELVGLLESVSKLINIILVNLNAGYIGSDPIAHALIGEEIEDLSNRFSTFQSIELGRYTYPYDHTDYMFLHSITLNKILILENIVMDSRAVIYRIYDKYGKINPKAMTIIQASDPKLRDTIFVIKARKNAEDLGYKISEWKEKNRIVLRLN